LSEVEEGRVRKIGVDLEMTHKELKFLLYDISKIGSDKTFQHIKEAYKYIERAQRALHLSITQDKS
jgi:hypothetical protein